MKLDIKTLRTFHRMARQGAEQAATRLSDITGHETVVKNTKVKFVTPSGIQKEIPTDRESITVSVDLDGGPGGSSVIMFDQDVAADITKTVLKLLEQEQGASVDKVDDVVVKDMPRSTVTEIANIMNCGFIDGWADVLDVAIDVSPPEFRSGNSTQQLFGDLDAVGSGIELALMFQSEIEIIGKEFSFRHFLFPSIDDLENALSNDRKIVNGFDFSKLVGFDEMVEEGAIGAAEHMEMLTGTNTSVDIRHLNFVRVDSIPQELEGQSVVGVAFTYDGLPSGYLLFVFSEDSARRIVKQLLPNAEDHDDLLDATGRDALQELGNIMASGVLDGWANVLGTMIDHSPPDYIHDIGPAVIDPIAAQVGQQQDYAFVFDTTISANEEEFDCSIFSISEEGDLEEALSRLDVDKLYKAREEPSFPIEGGGGGSVDKDIEKDVDVDV